MQPYILSRLQKDEDTQEETLFDKLDKVETPQKQGLLSRFLNRAKETLHIDTPQQTTDDKDDR